MVLAVISFDAYPFLNFSNLTCCLKDTKMVFSGCAVLPHSKDTKFGNSNQEAYELTADLSVLNLFLTY